MDFSGADDCYPGEKEEGGQDEKGPREWSPRNTVGAELEEASSERRAWPTRLGVLKKSWRVDLERQLSDSNRLPSNPSSGQSWLIFTFSMVKSFKVDYWSRPFARVEGSERTEQLLNTRLVDQVCSSVKTGGESRISESDYRAVQGGALLLRVFWFSVGTRQSPNPTFLVNRLNDWSSPVMAPASWLLCSLFYPCCPSIKLRSLHRFGRPCKLQEGSHALGSYE